ncbi:CD209 antigen-like protein E [Etheostoma spectabile]|uniref:CD209 antigen-like protein E n=1 Tax=Etheostoma spectabile TaxID=54343 RepID=UPI0013AFB677|nr:CD209 antigen-like protein E [Etheostoma spectabile]
MSADAVAAPRLSLNVRYNRNVQETSGEEEESQVEILEEEEHHADLGPQRAGPHTQNKPAANNRRRLKAAAVTLGGFFLLILAALFIRCTVLQIRYDQLSNNYTQLQGKVSETCCPDGWKRSGRSCYFKSKEKKYWFDSRADCEERGADLVVINNKEEQKFVSELSKDGESWTGLRYVARQEGWRWEWLDGSPLTETFWGPGLPHSGSYAACCNQQGKWTQSYSDTKTWICEKKIK